MRTRLVATLFGAALALCAGWSHAQRPGPAGSPPGVEVTRDVVYGTGGGRPLRMHLIRPKTPPAAPIPVLVWVHGGAWRAGHRDSGIPMLAPYAREGYFCASVEYRLSQEAKFPAQIQDCKCAVRFLRAKAAEYRLDPGRIGVWGSSAGGHLAALLGTSGDVKELEGSGGWAEHSSRVQAVCDWFGPTTFVKMNAAGSRMDHDSPESPESQLIGGPIQENREKAAKADPITYVSRDDPPFLIMHGDRDPLVPANQSELLHAALQRAKVPSELRILPGAGHGGSGFQTPEVRDRVSAFFRRYLVQRQSRPPAPATAPGSPR